MKKSMYKYIQKQDLPYIILVSILGCLNHFLYEWFHGSAFIALFCPVNESVWEHLKLLYFPFFFISIGLYIVKRPNILPFFYYRFLAVMYGMIFIVVSFYTYTGIIGTHLLFMDLLIYFFSVFLTFYLCTLFQEHRLKVPPQNVVFSLWIAVALCFFVFSCLPPNTGLFFPME